MSPARTTDLLEAGALALLGGARGVLQASAGDRDGLGVAVDEDEAAPELTADRAERARAGERVQAPAAGARGGGDHPSHDAGGLLRRIAGLLARVRRDDRVPPAVARALAARRLLRADEPGRHVRLAVDLVVV